MELRFHAARATKDLDFTVQVAAAGRTGGDVILEHLQDVGALDVAYSDDADHRRSEATLVRTLSPD